ncbi:hypothetical protein ACEW7V_02625 [Areca yellow leaf disease phytoplasma]|uniref:hypothetical protein n=1 Tax=Areca yellow leaf disease phytoplasma TaxID=927614 RepID=UPI0035B56AF3
MQLEEGTVDAILDFPINKITNARNKKILKSSKISKANVVFYLSKTKKVKRGKEN